MVSLKPLVLAALAGQAMAEVEPIVMKGQHFFYKNGTQFFMKGVAYQRDSGTSEAAKRDTDASSVDYFDPLADATRCARDVPILAAAGTNVIRTYAIDPTANHDECMTLLGDAGIYVISDLSSPDEAIIRSSPVWDTALYTRYTDVVDSLKGYKNVIGFFGGNEVTNNASNTDASAFVKAAVRDMKSYLNATADRWIGVGYAANDDSDIADNMAYYFNCGDQDDAIDFWGYNIYRWCGESTIEQSGYQTVLDFFDNYSVPVFFSEYGCNTVGGAAERTFEETTALYSSEMTEIIAGGIVYMYFQEENDYGLVSEINSKSVSTLKDYTSLSSRVNAAKPTLTDMDVYSATNTPAACPTVNADWHAADILPPTPDTDLCECMYNGLSCVAASDIDSDAYGELYGYICGEDAAYCAGVLTNATTGVYGAYSMCTSEQMLGYVLDQYYQGQKSADSACSFSGEATLKTAATASTCSSRLASASSQNAVAATATAGVTGTGSSSSSSSSGTSSSLAMPSVHKSLFSIGDLAIGLYMLVAMGAGAAVFAL